MNQLLQTHQRLYMLRYNRPKGVWRSVALKEENIKSVKGPRNIRSLLVKRENHNLNTAFPSLLRHIYRLGSSLLYEQK